MGCKSCGSGNGQLGVCRCCQLVDKDTKKRMVWWCSICKVWLCSQCYKDKPKRIKAFGKAMFENASEIVRAIKRRIMN